MKDGFYWARFTESAYFVVEVVGDQVWTTGSEDHYKLDVFTELALVMIPISPPDAP